MLSCQRSKYCIDTSKKERLLQNLPLWQRDELVEANVCRKSCCSKILSCTPSRLVWQIYSRRPAIKLNCKRKRLEIWLSSFLQNLKSDLRCLQKAIKKALLGFWDLPLCIDFCPFPKPKSIHSRGSDSAHRHVCQVGKSNCDLCCPLRSVRLSLNKRIVPERAADGNQNIWRMLNMVAGGDDPAAPESPTLGRHVWRIQYRPSEQQTPPNSMHRPVSSEQIPCAALCNMQCTLQWADHSALLRAICSVQGTSGHRLTTLGFREQFSTVSTKPTWGAALPLNWPIPESIKLYYHDNTHPAEGVGKKVGKTKDSTVRFQQGEIYS